MIQFTNIKSPWLQNPAVLALKTFVLKKIPCKSVRKILRRCFAESSSITGTSAFPTEYYPPTQGGYRGSVWTLCVRMMDTHWDDLIQHVSQRGGHSREVHRLRWGAGEGQMFFSDQTRTPRPGPKGHCNKVIQLSDFHQIWISVGFSCLFLEHDQVQSIAKW